MVRNNPVTLSDKKGLSPELTQREREVGLMFLDRVRKNRANRSFKKMNKGLMFNHMADEERAKNITQNKTKNAEKKNIVLKFENGLDISSNNILFIEAQQNYISIYYLDNNISKNHIERKTLSKIALERGGIIFIIC